MAKKRREVILMSNYENFAHTAFLKYYIKQPDYEGLATIPASL